MDNVQFYSNDEQPRRRRGNAFSTVVIIIVLLLLALMIVGLFWPSVLGVDQSPSQQATVPYIPSATAKPEMPPAAPETTDAPATAPESTVVPAAPTPTVAPEVRQMPTLDGVLPRLAADGENPIPDIYEAVAPGVVGILNYQSVNVGESEQMTAVGSGSGFIVSSDGYVLTNAHVVDGAAKITVLMEDGEEYDAVLAGADAEMDVAVVKMDKTGLQSLVLGDSSAVRVGEFVLAIGNPLSTKSLTNTLTYGIISAKDREITIDSYTNTYLQTDAAINFGNSGGPLLNIKGEVIGINSAKTVTAGYDMFGNALSAEGIGFALPINHVKQIMEELVTKGYVERPGVGVTVSTVTEARAAEQNLPLGAYVENVVRGGPAEKAGVQAGDVIVEADGKEVATHDALVDIVKDKVVGDKLPIRIYRAGSYINCEIVLENKSAMDFADVETNEN